MQKAFLTSQKEMDQPSRERLFRRILWTLFFLFLIPSYWAIIRYHYTVSPGADTFVHLQVVAQNRLNPFEWIYPPRPELFQGLVAFLANSLHLPVTQTYTWLAALAIPFSIVSLAYLARELFGRRIALIATIIAMTVSLQPWQTYNDGTVPNIIGIGILFPLILLWLTRAVKRRGNERILASLIAVFLLITLTFTHHLSTLITLATLLFTGAIFSIYRAVVGTSVRAKVLPISAYLVVLAVSLTIFLQADVLAPARQIFTTFMDIHTTWPYLTVIRGTNSYPWNSFLFGQDFGGGILQLGFVGGVALLLHRFRRKTLSFTTLAITCWFIIYFVGATVTWSGEPTRMARDLALPGCILSAYALVWLVTWLRSIEPRLVVVFVIAITAASLPYTARKLSAMTSESSLHYFNQVDEQAYHELTKNNLLSDTTIVSPNFFWQAILSARNPHLDPLPSIIAEQPIAADRLTKSRCVMVVEYKIPVLTPNPTPEDYREITLTKTYGVVETLENGTRRITFACQETVAEQWPTKTAETLLGAR